MKPPLKRVSFFPLLIFSAVLFCLFLTEGVFRIYVAIAKPLYRPSSIEGLGWEFTPHATNARRGTKPGPKAYLINDRGFRDKTNGNWTPWQNNDLKTVIVGDSVTAGPNVRYQDTYSAKLEEISKQHGAAIRVVNGGVDATNTRQQLAWLENRGLHLKPELVLLGYFMNDVETRSFESLPGFVQFFLRHFHFGVFLSQRIVQTVRNQREADRYQVDLNPGAQRASSCSGYVRETLLEYQTKKWPETAVWIQRMKSLCLAHGIRFGVVIFPFQDQTNGVCPLDAQKKITEYLIHNKISFLDLSKSLSPSDRESFYLPSDPVHLNEAGHGIAAKAIMEWLFDQGILQLKKDQ